MSEVAGTPGSEGAGDDGAANGDARRGESPDARDPHGRSISATVVLCDLCGSPMRESHCKLICDQCGYIRDCSDP